MKTYRQSWNEDHDVGLGKPSQGKGKAVIKVSISREGRQQKLNGFHVLGSIGLKLSLITQFTPQVLPSHRLRTGFSDEP